MGCGAITLPQIWRSVPHRGGPGQDHGGVAFHRGYTPTLPPGVRSIRLWSAHTCRNLYLASGTPVVRGFYRSKCRPQQAHCGEIHHSDLICQTVLHNRHAHLWNTICFFCHKPG